jgi:hypothetical protein
MIGAEITLDVPQGIGDIFWIYQKFAPYFDKINFNILTIADDAVQHRSGEFVKLLPQVGKSCFKKVSEADYHRVAGLKPDIKGIFDLYQKGRFAFEYSANRWLESGTRLDEIDLEYPIDICVPIRTDCCPTPYGRYLTAFVSGTNRSRTDLWNTDQWHKLVKGIYDRFNLPIILVGAGYDKNVLSEIGDRLTRQGVHNTVYIDSYISNICYIIRNSVFFVGFQSGLSCVADNFNVRQLMMYFPCLAPMTTSWVKRTNINNRVFQADYFSSSPEKVLCELKC